MSFFRLSRSGKSFEAKFHWITFLLLVLPNMITELFSDKVTRTDTVHVSVIFIYNMERSE